MACSDLQDSISRSHRITVIWKIMTNSCARRFLCLIFIFVSSIVGFAQRHEHEPRATPSVKLGKISFQHPVHRKRSRKWRLAWRRCIRLSTTTPCGILRRYCSTIQTALSLTGEKQYRCTTSFVLSEGESNCQSDLSCPVDTPKTSESTACELLVSQ